VSFLLLAIGVFALVAGLVMVGFGIPINEFSFGNTLISAGTTAAVGGLIIIALGVAVGQLRRIAEMLALQSHARPGQHMESMEGAGRMAPPPQGHGQGRPAFPQRPKSELKPEPFAKVEPFPDESAHAAVHAPENERAPQFAAPKLYNPEAPLSIEDDIALALQPTAAPPSAGADSGARFPVTPSFGAPPPPSPPPPQARMPQAPKFDAMWPADAKPPVKSEPKPEPAAKAGAMPIDDFPSVVKRPQTETQKPRAVAILKSGVVDGMGYTLYVDGSIEAELPQGTLRFASINELRSHLEKNG
jgi:hypothetical protein